MENHTALDAMIDMHSGPSALEPAAPPVQTATETVRISPRTGKPVRGYTKKGAATAIPVATPGASLATGHSFDPGTLARAQERFAQDVREAFLNARANDPRPCVDLIEVMGAALMESPRVAFMGCLVLLAGQTSEELETEGTAEKNFLGLSKKHVTEATRLAVMLDKDPDLCRATPADIQSACETAHCYRKQLFMVMADSKSVGVMSAR